jgi:hypothetical protein
MARVLVAWLLCAFAAAASDLETQFADPPARYGPSCYWWWFGGVYTPAEIRENLDALKSAGLGGFRIFPVYPLAKDDPARGIRNARYLSPEFLDLVSTAVQHGSKLGLVPESLLGTGWPYGGPYIPPELGAGRLKFFSEQIEGPREFSGRVPGEAKPPETLLAVQAAQVSAEGGVDLQTIIDITERIEAWELRGWNVPPGRWRLMTFVSGYTGMKVKRASLGGEGLVLDHFNRAALDLHLKHNGDRQAPHLKGALAVSMDSWEVFGSNWTPRLPEEFERRRGYALQPYLSAIFLPAGETGARVRYDFRRTISELALENFFAPLRDWAHGNGFKTRVEAHGTPADILEAYGLNDFPEGESYGEQDRRLINIRDRKLASSAGHLFGRHQISCETFTWLRYPMFLVTVENMKAAADAAYLDGVNQINYHGVPLSPNWAELPGWFYYAATNVSRGNTWWPYLRRLSDYLRRANFLLQQGTPVTDVAVYLPYEDVWSEAYGDWYDLAGAVEKRFSAGGAGSVSAALAALRDAGFDFDFINARRLAEARIEPRILKAGPMEYRAVVVPGVETIEPQALETLHRLCQAGGAVIATDRLPSRSSGLKNRTVDDAKVRALAERMFGPAGDCLFLPADPAAALAPRRQRLPALMAKRVPPDVVFHPPDPDVGFVHRRTESEDIYFLANVSPQAKRFRARFRAAGRAPTLYDAETASTRPLYPLRTEVELSLGPWGSSFVVLRDAPAHTIVAANVETIRSLNGNSAEAEVGSNGQFFIQTAARTIQASAGDLPAPLAIAGPWVLSKDSSAGLPLGALVSWTAFPHFRSFSGTASYRTSFDLPETYTRSRTRLILDLGEVRDIAEAALNGEPAGVAWKHPYEIDISRQAKVGRNELEVKVTNRLINRMLEAAPLPAPYVPLRDWIAEPVESGLLGPVRIRPVREITLE